MRGRDLGAVAGGAVVGAAVALMAVLIWTEMARPALFPTTVTALPTRFVIPVPTERPELPLPLTLTPEGLGLVSFGEDGEATVEKLEGSSGRRTATTVGRARTQPARRASSAGRTSGCS